MIGIIILCAFVGAVICGGGAASQVPGKGAKLGNGCGGAIGGAFLGALLGVAIVAFL
jgi:hypothetical protein